MKVIKKILLMTLILSLAIGTGVHVLAANFPDTDGTSLEQPVSVLSSLGILLGADDGNFKPEDPITREEFAAVVTRALGLENALEATPFEAIFSDVAEEDWSCKNIILAARMGIIDGFGDGTFGPKENITYEQAIKMIVCTLGYDVIAQSQGGYPFGHLSEAASLGLLENIEDGAFGEPVSRGIVAQLVYNALEVDIMEPTGFGEDISHVVRQGENLLTLKLGVTKGEGIVSGIPGTRMFVSTPDLRNGEVSIGETVLNIGEATYIKQMLGSKVTYYYKENKTLDQKDLILAREDERLEKLELNADAIYNVEGINTASAKLEYWMDDSKNSDTDTAILDQELTVVYNNASVERTDINNSLLQPTTGSIKLIDNNDDGKYELAIVQSFRTALANAVTSDNKMITCKGGAEPVDLSNNGKPEFHFTLINDGEEAELKSIRAYNALSIAESKDGNNITVIMSTYKTSGTVVEETTDNRGRRVLSIQEDEETVTDYIVAKDANVNAGLDFTGTFYLDYQGKIAGVEGTADTDKYGYLYAASGEPDGLRTAAQFEILTTDNEFIVFESAEKVLFNGKAFVAENGKSAGAQVLEQTVDRMVNGVNVEQLAFYKTDGTFKRQPVIFETNSKQQITKINTEIPAEAIKIYQEQGLETAKNYGYYDDPDGDQLVYERNDANIIFRPGPNTFKGIWSFNDSKTVCFKINSDGSAEKTDFACNRPSTWIAGDNTYYNVTAYNFNNVHVADMMVLDTGISSTVVEDTNFLVVDHVTDAVNDDDEIVKKVYGWRGLKKVEYQLAVYDNTMMQALSNAKRGDLFFIALDKQSQITAMSPIRFSYFDTSTYLGGDLPGGVSGDRTERKLVRVESIDYETNKFLGDESQFRTGTAEPSFRSFTLPSEILIVEGLDPNDPSAGKIRKASNAELQEGDIAVERSIYDGVQELIVYREK